MQTHQILDRSWSRLFSDLFALNGKDYIVLVDGYSDFIEMKCLQSITSATLIQFFKEQFSRHGIPDVLMIDNGPQYASQEFKDFAQSGSLSISLHHLTTQGPMAKQSLL